MKRSLEESREENSRLKSELANAKLEIQNLVNSYLNFKIITRLPKIQLDTRSSLNDKGSAHTGLK